MGKCLQSFLALGEDRIVILLVITNGVKSTDVYFFIFNLISKVKFPFFYRDPQYPSKSSLSLSTKLNYFCTGDISF